MKKSLIIFIILIIVILLISIALSLPKRPASKPVSPTPLPTLTPTLPPSVEFHGLSAKVKSVGDKYLVLQALTDQGLEEFKVYITDKTIIRKLWKNQEGKSEPKIEKINLPDIKTGDIVAVGSDENIAGKKEFQASIITVIVQ
jgi:hypothetical protein